MCFSAFEILTHYSRTSQIIFCFRFSCEKNYSIKAFVNSLYKEIERKILFKANERD